MKWTLMKKHECVVISLMFDLRGTIPHMVCCSVPKSCPTLYNSINYSKPSSSVHGVFQAKILEWIVISIG